MDQKDMIFLLCDHLQKIAEELIEIRKETAEIHRQLARIAQSLPLQLLTPTLEPEDNSQGEEDTPLIPEDLISLNMEP